MRINGLRKYYFEKKLKEKQNQFSSEIKGNRLSVNQIIKSDLKKSAYILRKCSIKKNYIFNEQNNQSNINKNLFESKEDKENFIPNESTHESRESKDTQENTIKNNNSNNSNYGIFRNSSRYNFVRKSNGQLNRYERLKLRLSMPNFFENNHNTNNEKEIKKDKCYNINYNNSNVGITFDGEIDDLINSTTSNIENEKEQKEQKNQENYEFQNYLEKVKKTKLSKNNLTKGSLAIIQMQISHAKEAILNNKYISYINMNNDDKKDMCFRLGNKNMCICGHGFSRHNLFLDGGEFKTNCKKCECNKFKYIPVFPEETNEYAKAYLLDFKYDDWKAGCKCGHNWTKHNFHDREKCEECNCECFESNFCCGVCGNPWEKHITLIQTKEERKKNGESYGDDYQPFTQEELEKLLQD